MSETQTGDIGSQAFIEALERLDRIFSEILRLGVERHVLELELCGYTALAGVEPIGFF